MSSERLAAGRLVGGRYELVRFLGRGGMGEVYVARRRALGDSVALKRLQPDHDSPNNRRRFATEAQAAAHIRHPNVVQVIDFGEDAEIGVFLVMELLEGHTLADEVSRGPMAPDRALWIFRQVCAAVEAGHRRGIVHRDLKPPNVMITVSDDGSELLKVLDFGLAVDQSDPQRDITTPGTVIGTVNYMAPEQAEGRPVTPASDIFALGVMLYELVTGELPFRGDNASATLLAISGGRYRPAEQLVPGLPAAIAQAIDTALAREPAQRPASAEQLARVAATGAASLREAWATAATPPHGTRIAARTRTLPPTADSTELAPVFGRFIGRGLELGRLRDEYARSLTGRARIALLTGDTGIGKSRLAAHFSIWARERGAIALAGRFYDYAGSRPPPLETFLAMLGEARDQVAARSLDGEATRTGDRWRSFAAITDALVGQAAGRPLVLVLDDLQWAGQLELDLIAHLHRTLGPRGTLVVATARTGESAELDAWRAHHAAALTEIPAPPFDETEVRAWLEGAFRPLLIGPLDIRRLVATSAGNLYALSEIVQHLVARGVFRRDEAGWRCAPLDSVELPDSVATVVRARLAELTADERRILELAAVIGDQFRVDTLAEAGRTREGELDGVLDAMIARRLLTDRGVTPGDHLRFATPLVRQVIYDDMPARQRRRAHLAVVEALAAIHGDADTRWAHVFGYHHHAIGAWRKAIAFGVRAAAEALSRHDFDATRVAIGRATDAARRADAERAEVDLLDRARLDLVAGVLLVVEGRYEDAELHLARAAETARDLGNVEIQLDARRHRALAVLGRGDHAGALAVARRAADEADAHGERLRALEARAVVANAAMRGGTPEAGALVDSLVAATSPDDPPALRARILRARSWLRMKRGAWSAAQDDADTALGLARAAADVEAEQQVVGLLAAIRSESGDHAAAVELERQSLVLALRLGDRRREAIARANLAEALTGAGHPDEGLELLRGALGIFVDIGDRASEGDCRVNVGRALLALDRRGEAIAALERGIELCAATARREYEGIGNLLLGRARLDDGDVPAARAAYERAGEAFEAIDFHLRWQADLGAARAAHRDGDAAAARGFLASARAQVAAQRAGAAPGDRKALDAAGPELDEIEAEIDALPAHSARGALT